jgi:molybdopterin-guanine dinucleotide biosynthesis protein A
MGSPKALLPWHGSTLVRRVAGLVARAVDGPVVVVRAPGQALPPLPVGVEVTDDPVEGRGPLAGLLAGLTALDGRAEAVYLSAVDVPRLHPAFVRHVVAGLEDGNGHGRVDAVLPEAHGHRHPLAAAYRAGVRPRVAALLEADRLRPAFLLDQIDVRRLDEAALLADPGVRAADPDLRSLENLNAPEDYERALEAPEPAVTVARFGTLRPAGARAPVGVRASSVARAAAAVGLDLDRHVVAAVDGDRISGDPDVPLAGGETVSFLSAEAGG